MGYHRNFKPTFDYYDNEHPSLVLPQLKRLIKRRASEKACTHFYIGRTTDPTRRLAEHQRKLRDKGLTTWTDMQVIYGNQSLGFVSEVEKTLINHGSEIINTDGKRKLYNDVLVNHEQKQTFSVYVLIDENRVNAETSKDPLTDFESAEARSTSFKEGREKALFQSFKKAVTNPLTGKLVEYIYIGFTCSPDRRFKEHQRDAGKDNQWDRMQVLYTSSSINRAIEAEAYLFQKAKEMFKFNKVVTTATHSLDEGRYPYSYVYMLEERE